ncbi:MAG: excisionase [Alphaproteobacteria bacterium]|nr:MAG: excisionase [Alphaproteobacteria bacterium]
MESMYLTARETAERLGIKRDTLYAYVSRGLLRSQPIPGSRERGYRTEEVERLRAGRGLSRATRSEPFVPVIDSAICLIEGGRLYYRGHDAIRLAETTTLEDIAGLLWGQDPISTFRHSQRSEARGIGGRVGAAASLGVIERCHVRLAELAAADLGALDLTPHGIVRTGRAILYELAACIGDRPTAPDPVHEQLAALWRLDQKGADLIRRCLVLLADHELNASTFVARCVASTGATPYAVVSGALAALSGRRHGGASASAEALLHEIAERDDPLAVMAARLARNEMLPGLGHPLYPAGDPRAAALLNAAMAAIPASRPLIEAAVAAARQLVPQPPNVDFALAAATTALGLPQGTALAIFILGRTVGWIAHAIEQYQSDVLIRPRARYTGPRPGEENPA